MPAGSFKFDKNLKLPFYSLGIYPFRRSTHNCLVILALYAAIWPICPFIWYIAYNPRPVGLGVKAVVKRLIITAALPLN